MDPNNFGPNGPSENLAQSSAAPTIDVVRTYLHLPTLAALRPAPAPKVPVRLERLVPCPVATWRALYAQIGGPWHWHDRDAWDDDRIQFRLGLADVQVYQLTAELGTTAPFTAGFLELERHPDGSTEIVYLGIDQRAFGQGIGGWLLTEAVRVAFADGANRVWLHTCTLDSPAALPNYLQRGFVIDRTETYRAPLHT